MFGLRRLKMSAPKDPKKYEEWKRKISLNHRTYQTKETIQKILITRKGYKHSEETKQKIRDNAKNNPHYGNKGRKFSEEHRRKIASKLRIANLGKHHSEESKLKLSKNSKINPNYGMKNKYHSEESRQKMSLAHKKYLEKNPEALERWKSINKGKQAWNKDTKNGIYKQCECGKKFYVIPNAIDNRLYCSLDCCYKYRPIWNKGRYLTQEHRNKLSISHLGKISFKLGKTYEELYGEEKAKKIKERYKKWRTNFILPKYDTKIEVKIQMFLKELGYEYFTHQYMKIEHGYQCDILIPALNIVIECDGDYWHKYPIGKDVDHIRTSELLEKGFKVLRLWECEINEMNINKFKEDLDIIKREIGK